MGQHQSAQSRTWKVPLGKAHQEGNFRSWQPPPAADPSTDLGCLLLRPRHHEAAEAACCGLSIPVTHRTSGCDKCLCTPQSLGFLVPQPEQLEQVLSVEGSNPGDKDGSKNSLRATGLCILLERCKKFNIVMKYSLVLKKATLVNESKVEEMDVTAYWVVASPKGELLHVTLKHRDLK